MIRDWFISKKKLLSYVERLEFQVNTLQSAVKTGTSWDELEKDGKLVSFSEEEGFSIQIAVARVFAQSFWDLIQTFPDAKNYLEMEFNPVRLLESPLIVTIQKKWGKSPSDTIKELKAEIETLKNEISLAKR